MPITRQVPTMPRLAEHTPGPILLGNIQYDFTSDATQPLQTGMTVIVPSAARSLLRAEIVGIVPQPGQPDRAASVRAQIYYIARGADYETSTQINTQIALRNSTGTLATHNYQVSITNRTADPWTPTATQTFFPTTASLPEGLAGPIPIAYLVIIFSSPAGKIPDDLTVSLTGSAASKYTASYSRIGSGTDRAGSYITGMLVAICYTGAGETFDDKTAANNTHRIGVRTITSASADRGLASATLTSPVLPINILQSAAGTPDPPIAPPTTPDPEEPDPEEPPTPDRPITPPAPEDPKPVGNPNSDVPTIVSIRVGTPRVINIRNAWIYRTTGAAPSWTAASAFPSRLPNPTVAANGDMTLNGLAPGNNIIVEVRATDGGQRSDDILRIAVSVLPATTPPAEVPGDEGQGGGIGGTIAPPAFQTDIENVVLYFIYPRLRDLPEHLDASENLDFANSRFGYHVGWLHGAYYTSGIAGAFSINLQGTGSDRFYLGSPALTARTGGLTGSGNSFAVPVYYIGGGEDRSERTYFNLRAIGIVAPNTSPANHNIPTNGTRQAQDFTIPVRSVEIPDALDIFELADAVVPGQKDLQLAQQVNYELSKLNAVAVEATLAPSHQAKGGKLAFISRQDVEDVEEKPYRIRQPADIVFHLAPLDDDKGGDLYCWWRTSDGRLVKQHYPADYWHYDRTYEFGVFADDEGDRYTLASGGLTTATTGQTASAWISPAPVPKTGSDSYKMDYHAVQPRSANTPERNGDFIDVVLNQVLIAQQPAGTRRADATQKLIFKPWKPAPLHTPTATQTIAIPYTSDARKIDLSQYLANPDNRLFQSYILAQGSRTQTTSSTGGHYTLSELTNLTCARRVIGGVKQVNPNGERVSVYFNTGTTQTSGRGIDLGPTSTAHIDFIVHWNAPPGITTSYNLPISPGLINIDPTDQAGRSVDVSAVVINSGNRPLTAYHVARDGSHETEWDVLPGVQMRLTQDSRGHWLLTAHRHGDWPAGSAETTTEMIINVSTADDFAPVVVQQHWRLHARPPSS